MDKKRLLEIAGVEERRFEIEVRVNGKTVLRGPGLIENVGEGETEFVIEDAHSDKQYIVQVPGEYA